MFRRLHPINRIIGSALAMAAALSLPAATLFAHDPVAPAEQLHRAGAPASDPIPLALMGTIPIYWGEGDDAFAAQITGALEPHWARAVLEEEFALRPLDYLNPDALAGHSFLLMAQPRGLTGEENVALDAWVRGGGRLLLLADPAMTGHSHYGIGDRRRPQDTALLSPILSHWGLELLFDADQAPGLQLREYAGEHAGEGDPIAIPVNLPGRFAQNDSQADCGLYAAQILAFCRIGTGYATILSDAAVLDHDGPWLGSPEALRHLHDMAFGRLREPSGAGHQEPENDHQGIESSAGTIARPDLTKAHSSPH